MCVGSILKKKFPKERSPMQLSSYVEALLPQAAPLVEVLGD